MAFIFVHDVALWVSHIIKEGEFSCCSNALQAKSGVAGKEQKQKKIQINLSRVQKCSMCMQ